METGTAILITCLVLGLLSFFGYLAYLYSKQKANGCTPANTPAGGGSACSSTSVTLPTLTNTSISSGIYLESSIGTTDAIFLKSLNGAYAMVLQSNGNLIVQDSKNVLKWSAGLNFPAGTSKLYFTNSGNLYVSDGNKTEYIYRSASSLCAFTLTMTDAGAAQIKDSTGKILWNTPSQA